MGSLGVGAGWGMAVRSSHQGSDPKLVLSCMHACVLICVCEGWHPCPCSPPPMTKENKEDEQEKPEKEGKGKQLLTFLSILAATAASSLGCLDSLMV